jgi:hypothetical protein
VARLTGGEEGPVKGWVGPRGPGGHVKVRIIDGDGWNRADRVRRRSGSSAACAPAYSRR